MSSVSVQTLRSSSLRQHAGMSVVRRGRGARRDPAVHDCLMQQLQQLQRKPKKLRKLDGFLMLEACKVELPAEAVHARLVDKALVSVVAEDLKYFVRLEWVDAGENQLRLEMFSVLPSLKELRLHCNAISHVPPLSGFQALQRLDMSYNSLDAESIQNLSSLGALRELDLSGNQLSYLPDMDGFANLERLILEYNCFAHDDIFHELARLPRLRHLSCAHNLLRGIQVPQSPGSRSFSVLEVLDLAHNKIEASNSLGSVLSFPRLRAVLLYGNPLCGPTGEDPAQLCVEELVVAAIETGRSPADTLQFVTEAPRKKKRRWNQHPGRQAFYRNIDMKHVATFEDIMNEGSPEAPPDAPGSFSKYVESLNLGVPDPRAADTFLTGMDLPVQRRADTMFDLRRTIEATVRKATKKAVSSTSPERLGSPLHATEAEGTEVVPEQLLHGAFDQPLEARTEARPKALQQAMKELQYTLEHPVEPPGSLPFYGSHLVSFLQPTALTIVRQRPPRQPPSIADPLKDAELAALRDTKQAMNARTLSSSSRRPDFRKLRQIERALDVFNATTNQVAERVAAEILSGERQPLDFALPGPSLQSKVHDISDLLNGDGGNSGDGGHYDSSIR